jgi:hypothetical protein
MRRRDGLIRSSTRELAVWPEAVSGVPEGGDEGRGVWKDRLRHDEASHGADAFLTFACSGYQPPSAYVPRKRILRGIV